MVEAQTVADTLMAATVNAVALQLPEFSTYRIIYRFIAMEEEFNLHVPASECFYTVKPSLSLPKVASGQGPPLYSYGWSIPVCGLTILGKEHDMPADLLLILLLRAGIERNPGSNISQ